MPDVGGLTHLGQEALILGLLLSLPVVGAAAIVGFAVAVFQAATQVQDATLAHLPRVLVVALVLAVAGPWMGGEIAAFAVRAMFGG
jgi:type III secretion HrpO family protein